MQQSPEGKNKSLREKLRVGVIVPMMFAQWAYHAIKYRRKPDNRQPLNSVILVSADVQNPLGSKGDEAMIIAVAQHIRKSNPKCRIALAACDIQPPELLRSYNIECLPVWRWPWRMSRVMEELKPFDGVYFVGADVMDGYYSTVTSFRLWMVADLIARAGKRAVIGGCSFNTMATSMTKLFLRRFVSKELDVCIRDPASLERFRATSRNPGTIVADAAFLLEPKATNATAPIAAWIEHEKAQGRLICGFNIHPMLVPDRNPAQLEAFIYSAAIVANRLVKENNVSLLLIPHDFRESGQSDLVLLQKVLAETGLKDKILLTDGLRQSSEIKFAASCCELVITGRMHLAIGALGSGTPVVVIDYQDKFQGLFDHFGMPHDFIISPAQAMDPVVFYRTCSAAIARRSELRSQVADHLPIVGAHAARNVETILAA